MGLGMQASRAAAYEGYIASCPVRVLRVGEGFGYHYKLLCCLFTVALEFPCYIY